LGQLDGSDAFHQLEESCQMLFHQMLDRFALCEMIFDAAGKPADFRYLAVNPAFETMTGLRAESVVGKRVLEALPTTEPHWIETYGRVVLTGEPNRFESFHAGVGRHFDVVAFRPREGQFASVFQDVTKRKEHELQIERLNRLYAVLSQVNQAIARSRSREELFHNICRVAVTFGHFRLAWIGAWDADSESVKLEAKDTDERGFPYEIQANECGVVHSAIREGRPCVYNALTGGESSATCLAHAMQADIGSCAAWPIVSQGRVCAAFCLHAREAGFFNPAEIQLIERVALDISFALDKLEEEARRRQVEEEARKAAEALLESQRFVQRILDITPDLVYIYDLIEQRSVYANRSALDLLGYTPEQIQGMGSAVFQNILHPDDAALVAAHHARFATAGDNEPLEVEYRMKHANGQWRWLRSRDVLFLRDSQGAARRILGSAEDITERKWNEAVREATLSLLHLLNAPNETHELIRTVTGFLQQWSGCEAVGVLLRQGDGFPYYETRGIPAEFVQAGNDLCVRDENREPAPDGQGNPVTDCLCGDILCGRFNPGDPGFTAYGSFWTNAASELMQSAECGRLSSVLDQRHGEGRESVALIPLRYGGQTFGLIRFYDRHKGRFTAESILMLERAAGNLAIAMQQRLTQAALRSSEERYRLISENTADVIWLMDPATKRLTYISPSVERLLGYSTEEIMAKGLPDVLTPESYRYVAGRLAEGLAAIAAGDSSVRTQTNQADQVRKDGSVVRVEVVTTLLLDERGQVREILGVTRDITERLQAEARLAQAQKMESVGRLAGGVAHDFNNLLTVINGYTQMLIGDVSPADPLREGLEEIRKAGERAAALTAQLLAFSRKQVLQPRALDLNRVAGAMEPMLARLVGEDVEVRVVLSAEECVVRADPHQLEQAIMNLAVNARDAMPQGGKLLIETAAVEWEPRNAQLHPGARPGRYVMLAVSDTGVGMDEATRSKIFEPFFTTKGVGKGTGLGLSTVQGIVAQSGGHIEVYSELGSGTTFKIYLPGVAEAVALEGRPETAPTLGGTETVLVVEDQTDVRDYAAKALESYSYRVLKAESAAEALSICEREGERIDLVLTDVVMPGFSGLELAGRLEKLRPGIRILYMSGYTDNAIIQRGVLDDGAAFITKPFGPERLAAKVRAALGPHKRP
jgi:PAS domain S-box-containing protein